MRSQRVVQTELDSALYDFVARTAEAKGLSLKEATRQALADWAAREGDISWDPLFDTSKTFGGGKPTDASRVNRVVYGRRRR